MVNLERLYSRKVALCGEGIHDPESDFVGFLKTCQVAIGIQAGSEVIIHNTLRQWCVRNQGTPGIGLLKRDYENAFNNADEHEFLTACHEWLPGCARIAEWCYGETVNLVYHGRILHSHEGQQGSPLMMPMFCAMRQKIRHATPSARDLSVVADYADDGMDGGTLQKIWETIQEEKLIADMHGVKFNFKKMKLYLMAGDDYNPTQDPDIDRLIRNFRGLGIKIDTSCNIKFMKVPLIGDEPFAKKWIDSKLQKLKETLDVVGKLPKPHVAYYLLRRAAGTCKVLFWMRTMPQEMAGELFREFDAEQKRVFEKLAGTSLNGDQWKLAQQPIRVGGCGIRGAEEGADASYVMSRL